MGIKILRNLETYVNSPIYKNVPVTLMDKIQKNKIYIMKYLENKLIIKALKFLTWEKCLKLY